MNPQHAQIQHITKYQIPHHKYPLLKQLHHNATQPNHLHSLALKSHVYNHLHTTTTLNQTWEEYATLDTHLEEQYRKEYYFKSFVVAALCGRHLRNDKYAQEHYGTWTQEHYNILTLPWRIAIGPTHHQDTQLTPQQQQIGLLMLPTWKHTATELLATLTIM